MNYFDFINVFIKQFKFDLLFNKKLYFYFIFDFIYLYLLKSNKFLININNLNLEIKIIILNLFKLDYSNFLRKFNLSFILLFLGSLFIIEKFLYFKYYFFEFLQLYNFFSSKDLNNNNLVLKNKFDLNNILLNYNYTNICKIYLNLENYTKFFNFRFFLKIAKFYINNKFLSSLLDFFLSFFDILKFNRNDYFYFVFKKLDFYFLNFFFIIFEINLIKFFYKYNFFF